MATVPRVSVVIPTYNRADALPVTLAHLVQQTMPADEFEVIIADDGSTDGSEQLAAEQQMPYRVEYLRQANRGAAATRNLGARHARAPLILFLDSDVAADARLIEQHWQCYQNDGERLVVGRIRTWDHARRPWYDTVIDPDRAMMDYGEQARSVPFYMAMSCNLSMPRSVFEALGGFDEAFPAAGCEETELAYRAEKRGWELWYEALAVGYHNHPRNLRMRCRQQREHMRSMPLLIAKHPEVRGVIPGVEELMPWSSRPLTGKMLWRRAKASLYGSAPSRAFFGGLLTWLDERQAMPRLAKIAFWRLMRGWVWAGFREGWRLYQR